MEPNRNIDKLELEKLQENLSHIQEEDLPVSKVGYVVTTVVCGLTMTLVSVLMFKLGANPLTIVQVNFCLLLISFCYTLFFMKPSTEEAESLAALADSAIKLEAVLNIRVVQLQYSRTTYYDFIFKNKELDYETKVSATKLSFAAREELESPLHGEDCDTDNLSNEVRLKNIYLIAQPHPEKQCGLILLVWRDHYIWCKTEKNFDLDLLKMEAADSIPSASSSSHGSEVDVRKNEIARGNPAVTCALSITYSLVGVTLGFLFITLFWHIPFLALATSPQMISFLTVTLIGSGIISYQLYSMESRPAQFGTPAAKIRLRLPLIMVIIPIFMIVAHLMNSLRP